MRSVRLFLKTISVHLKARKDFVGVKNIRQYEDRELRAQEERKQKRFEFQKQVNRITSNLEFEKSRDTLSNVSRWERAVNDEEEKLETAKKQEAKQRDDIDKDLKQLDELKAQKMSKKKEVEEMEEELGKLTQSFKFDITFMSSYFRKSSSRSGQYKQRPSSHPKISCINWKQNWKPKRRPTCSFDALQGNFVVNF